MIELLLIFGLLFVLGTAAFMHIVSTINLAYMEDLTGSDNADPTLHPWFFTTEAILGLTILYLIIQLV